MSHTTKRKRRRKKRLPVDPVEAIIDSLSDEGRGISHIDSRAVFIEQALVGERVLFNYTRLTNKIAEGRSVEVLHASTDRVKPKCSAFGRCGGCSLQHMDHDAQITMKQDSLLKQLKNIGHVEPVNVLQPITGQVWGYRRKARLGVRYVAKKDRVLVGFRERGSSFITETDVCEIMHQDVGQLIKPLANCISQLELKRQIPQIEVAVGDNQTVLVFRHLELMPLADRKKLITLAQDHGLVIMLQAGSPDELELLWPESADHLFYDLHDYNIRIEFEPGDFTQVNNEVNHQMIRRAIEVLHPAKDDHVLDLFSGLGNFTLPLATQCAHVTGIEGSQSMVSKARVNAERNGIVNASFHYADLYSDDVGDAAWIKQPYDRVLLDPPRSGAANILGHIKRMKAKCIVYVSCHPATLARDANVIANEMGYTLTKAGIVDMFPHTAHVESIAVFGKD
ncbi:MAG: 23S rRNA (uracil(1939)-C(5))-methyltransferase RlmD [Gammaproteobacteria bacterium]|nr:23S rRNA (uracil(1939)-C(5))-methyltransferase RlmD [Gammaproteobacteria bacterium]NNJ96754.1 23S rRNA (uracil(1939)-C(5))-methyltransferase RlmD [Gammaproteobacteria bacterium]